MNKRAIAGWVLSVLVMLFLIFSASGKFLDWEGKTEMFAKMGWGVAVMKRIGAVEVALALLLLVPRAAFWRPCCSPLTTAAPWRPTCG